MGAEGYKLRAVTRKGDSIAFNAVIDLKIDSGYSGNPGFQTAVAEQTQPAVARSFVIDLELHTVRRELHTGGRRGQQAHTVALLIELLMDMPPEHRLHLRVAVGDTEQVMGVTNTDGLQPLTTHGQRVVMKANQHLPLASRGQLTFQQLYLIGG